MMVTISTDPGICGFISIVHAVQSRPDGVSVSIESDCEQVMVFAEQLELLSIRDIYFHPFNMNPVYDIAGRSNLHPGCPLPIAVIKAAEVALGVALKKDVMLTFIESKRSI